MQKRPALANSADSSIFRQDYIINGSVLYVEKSIIDDYHPYLHYHDYFELGRVTSGIGSFIIGDKTYSYGVGDISVVLPGELHITNSLRHSISIWEFIVIDSKLLFQRDIDAKLLCTCIGDAHGLILKPGECPALSELFCQLSAEAASPGEIGSELQCLLFHTFLIRYLRHIAGLGEKSSHMARFADSPKGLCAPAIVEILSRYNESLTVAHLASLCHMSQTNFRRIFKAETGHSPLHYLTLIRMNSARALLDGSNRSITDIAYVVGYSSMSSFFRNFKSFCGKNPSEYRKSMKLPSYKY